MFDFGKSLINMNPDEQKKLLDTATPSQRKTALEMGIGFKNQNQQQQQQRQKKRDAYHDLDRLNFTVEKENEAHDFFGKGLGDWQKGVTGNNPSKDATNLRKQFDDYEHKLLLSVPKGGKRHTALADSLPKIKDGFLKKGHQFAVEKLNERSKNVLDKGLQRIAQGALKANDEKDIQTHDDAAFDLINKYVLSEAKFDEKDADAMYDKYLGYAGVDVEKARAADNEEVPGAKPGFKMEDAEMLAENDTNAMADAEGEGKTEDAELQIPEGKDEVYDGNQYRGKAKTTDDVKPSEKVTKEKTKTEDDKALSSERTKPIDRLPSDDMKGSLKKSEGFEAKPYNDSAGHCTIGYGHLLHKGACTDEDFEKYKEGWTEDHANKVFDEDIAKHEEDVKKHVNVDLTQGEYDALVHFAYNIGGDEFKDSTLLKKLNAGDYDSVPEEMRRWINITVNGKKQVSEGLKKRREREIEMFKKK